MGRLHDLAAVMRGAYHAKDENFNAMLQSLWRESNLMDERPPEL